VSARLSMKLSLGVGKDRRGLTLVELLVAGVISGLVLSSLCGVYFAVHRQFERGQGQQFALLATSQACSKLSDYISQACGVVAIDRFYAGDTLAVNLPDNQAYEVYVPTWQNGQMQYVSGDWIVFYLSDSTGSYYHTGDILWAATMAWDDYPASVSPDQAWSLRKGVQSGRITPLRSLRFVVSADGQVVTITAVSAYTVGSDESQFSLCRTVYVRNG